MKKLLIIAAVASTGIFGTPYYVSAAKETPKVEASAQKKDTAAAEAKATEEAPVAEEAPAKADAPKETVSFHQVVKTKFIEGDVLFMAPILICLILGLAICIERIIVLNLASTNTSKLLSNIKDALKTGGVDAARDLCARTPGPVASIFAQGLLRSSEGIDSVEKTVIAYGGLEMSKLEKGLTWISLFIGLAPMLGFMGTVIGMIQAFDMIAAADDISASIVAVGIKVALLTTVGGLIAAMILQILYNYCISKIDSIVSEMEEASISMVDILIAHDLTSKK